MHSRLSASDDSDDGVAEEGKAGVSSSVSTMPSWTELVPGYKHGSSGEQAADAGKDDDDDSDDDDVGVGGSMDGAGKGLQTLHAEKVAATNSGFPDVNNLDASIRYLNEMLVVYGFPSPLDLTPAPSDNAAVARTCNCLYALLQQRQRDIEFRDSMNEQRQRLVSATSRLEAKVERLETQLSGKDRELTTMTLEKQKMAASHRVQVDKLQAERDEFQRMSIGMQQLRVQQTHEIRKKEKEYTKLQERLNQVVMEKKKESKAGMDIVNMLQKEGRQRGTWSGKKADSDFYKMIVDSYEAKKQELLVENADLRASLRSLQADMRELLNSQGHVKGEANQMGAGVMTPCETPLRGRTDIFDLPYHLTRDEIENSMRAKIASIRERMEHLQSAQSMAPERETATQRELDLEAQLLEARSLIQEQESIIQMSISIGDAPRHSERMSMELQKEAALSAMEEDRALLEERKHQLESERAAYESMALQLDEERRKLGRERRKLEEEQRAWQTSLQLWGGANVTSPQEEGHHHILGSASDLDVSHSKLKQNAADRLLQEEKFRLPIPPLGDTI